MIFEKTIKKITENFDMYLIYFALIFFGLVFVFLLVTDLFGVYIEDITLNKTNEIITNFDILIACLDGCNFDNNYLTDECLSFCKERYGGL